MRRRALALSILAFGLLLTLWAGSGPLSARADKSLSRPLAGFNRDPYADLAIGVPRNDSAGVTDAGAINVLYGSGEGLSLVGVQYWHQDRLGIVDTAEPYDLFGHALAAGDFNGDGLADLAVGVPKQAVNGHVRAGAVHVLYGYAGGLSIFNNKVWHQDTGSIQDLAEDEDLFGWTLAAGDFDGDGFDDLAVGVPFEDRLDLEDSGIVQVLYGGPDGLTDVGNELWCQGAGGLPDTEEFGDRFGEALTVGDFDADSRDDLAIGVLSEDFEDPPPIRYAVGVVHVLYGSADGLTSEQSDFWHQDRAYVEDESEPGDSFSWALTAGDFDGDGRDDLAVGVPGEAVGGDSWAGAVHVLFGGPNGLTSVLDVLLDLEDLGLEAAAYDGFGRALAAGDFDGDGHDDLTVGVPGRDFLGITPEDAGSVIILYGSDSGPSTARSITWYQGELFDLADTPEEYDQFGYSLAVGDFDHNGCCDLAIGVPYEDITYASEIKVDAGGVHVLYGSPIGLGNAGANDLWLVQDNSTVPDAPDHYELFGYSLAAVPDLLHLVHLPLVLRAP